MIPNLKPLIEPLTMRFADAWEKAKKPHDDGEFNARVCAVLHYEMAMPEVGRNGKRGNPRDLSRDIINWRGEGPNPDPTTGKFGTIIDFIVGHEASNAKIDQFYPDPSGPGAWVKPLTLAEIDAGTQPTPQPPTNIIPDYEAMGGDSFGRAMIGVPLAADYLMAGQPMNDGSVVWAWRTCHSLMTALVKANGQPIDAAGIVKKHRNEWRAILGLPPV